MGIVLRAVGHGMPALVVQFIKNDPSTGEIQVLDQLAGAEIVQMGLGFIPPPDSETFQEHVEAAEKGLQLAEEVLRSGRYRVVVLDEVCFAVASKLLPEQEVLRVIQGTPPETCVVLTGRGATDGLLALADTVTDMRCLKHGYDEGIKAQTGVEF
jgi:cob(I)alamin adenosyltransferase